MIKIPFDSRFSILLYARITNSRHAFHQSDQSNTSKSKLINSLVNIEYDCTRRFAILVLQLMASLQSATHRKLNEHFIRLYGFRLKSIPNRCYNSSRGHLYVQGVIIISTRCYLVHKF